MDLFAAFSSSVNTFLVLGFGFGLGFAFDLSAGFAFALFCPEAVGSALGFFVRVAFLVVAGPAAGRAFFLGVLVVLPVCALGLDAGLVAKDRDVDELPLLPMCVLRHCRRVEYDLATRSRLVGVKATRLAVKAATVDCGRRTKVRTIGKIMADAFA